MSEQPLDRNLRAFKEVARRLDEYDRMRELNADLLAALKAMVLNDEHIYRDCHKAAVAVIAKATEGKS